MAVRQEGKVVHGAACRWLLLSQGHELLLRGRCARAHLPCQDWRGPGIDRGVRDNPGRRVCGKWANVLIW